MKIKYLTLPVENFVIRKPLIIVAVLLLSSWMPFVLAPPEVSVEIPFPEQVSIPPAPTAASLGKYAEFPIDESSGTPNISIPLYHIKSGQLDLPITLSYHPSGIKVSESASWVGLGWSLNAGGVITRTMRGLPDESGSKGYLQIWDLVKNFSEGADGTDELGYDLLQQMSRGEIDGEPDLFNYNFSGQRGSFVFNPEGGAMTIPYKPLKVELRSQYKFAGMADQFPLGTLKPGLPPPDVVMDLFDIRDLYYGSESDSVFHVYSAFRVTGEDGVIYKFSRSEKTEVQIHGANQEYLSSWYLTEMISADARDTIAFKYKANSSDISYGANYSEQIKKEYNNFSNPSPTCSFSQVYVRDAAILEKIIFKGGEIVFTSTSDRNDLTNGTRLNKITITSKDETYSKDIDLFYEYFNSSSVNDNSAPCNLGITSSDYYRLKLKWVRESGNGDYKPKYFFEYNNTMLPQKKSRNQDHWGYYNAANNITLIPKVHYSDQETGSADRSSNENAMKACSLSKIIYPTGGYTEFDFEANKFIYTSTVETFDQPQYHKLFAVNSTESSHVTETYNWPGPYLCESGPCEIEYEDDVRLKVEFATVANNDGTPQTYVKDPAFELIKKNGPLIIRVPFQDYYDSYYDAQAGMVYHFYETTLNLPNITTDAYDFRLTTSTDERNYIKATLTAGATVNIEPVTYTVPIGGLRIKEMRSYDRNGHMAKAESYEYPSAQLNSSYLYRTHYENNDAYVRVYNESQGQYVSGAGGSSSGCNINETKYLLVGEKPFGNLAGGGVASYNKVIKYFNTNQNNDNGKIVSYFKIPADNLSNSYPYPPAFSNSWRRGLLSKREIYNSSSVKVSEESHFFDYDVIEQAEGMKVGFSNSYISGDCYQNHDLSDFIISRFEINSTWVKKNISVYTNYYTSGESRSIAETYNYDNPNHAQMTQKVVKDSEGEKLLYEYTYPPDYELVLQEDPVINHTGIFEMMGRHNLNTVVESRILSIIESDTSVISAVSKEFEDGKPTSIYRVPIETPIPIATFKRSERDDFDNRYELHTSLLYDDGNIKFLNSWDGLNKTYQWNENRQIISETLNAEPNQVFYTSFENSSENDSDSKTGSYSHVGTYTVYQPAGSGDYTLTYWKINNGEWQFIELPMDNPSVTIGDVGSLIDEVRIIPTASHMTTYTYDPLQGLSAITDYNNMTVEYTYDNLGRLRLIKNDQGNILKKYDYKYHQP